MSDEKMDKEPRYPAHSDELDRNVRGHPETNFLPPLKMFLAFFDKEARQKKKQAAKQENPDEKNVEKIIEKLSENEEEKKQK